MTIKNYYCKQWTIKELKGMDELYEVRKLTKDYSIIGFDTETTGLHIILDKAFCLTFAMVNMEERLGKAYVVDLRYRNRAFIECLENILLSAKKLIAWNTKFDLHMTYNVGMEKLIKHPGLTDAMIYARLANAALTSKNGGVTLKLKPYSAKYLDSDAQYYEKKVAEAKKELKIQRNKILKDMGVKVGELNEFLKDKINTVDDLPKEIRDILLDTSYNPDNYANIPWHILKQYAAFDSIFAVENYIRDSQIVEKREQTRIAEREEQLIPILWNMERPGFKLNILYLKQARQTMKEYIIQRRQELVDLVGQPLKVGQHDLIKDIFFNKFGIILDKSDEEALSEIHNGKPGEIASLIIELRTLEKWFSTYIVKWDEDSSRIDRIYTSFKQVGAVSGRFSCDFQQFPKEPIYKKDGTLLFSPRRIVMVSGDEYDQLCLIDYAAEELRIQALYTMLIKKPDVNLCRAYIPMECTERDGVYYLNEAPEVEWKPTDLHSLTALTAFPELKPTDPDFGHYRKIGKSTNFACNYGANKNTLVKQFGFSEDMATKLYNAYTTAYSGVAKYREYVKELLRYQNYVTNLFGRRYYDCPYHNATNYLVQGSAADLLKIKLIELNNLLVINGYKSRILCTIHDEIMFEIHKDEHDIIYEFKRIMEDVPNSPIPFSAEISISWTTWDAKKEI